ncbi:MAG: energy-dependent translational throttle protein EttA [Humibacter sp.]
MSGEHWVARLENAAVTRSGKAVLENVNLTIAEHDRVGVIGPNGAGKSTLLGVIAGTDASAAGSATTAPGISVGILMQEPVLRDDETVLENIEDAISETITARALYDDAARRLADDGSEDALTELGELQEYLDGVDGWDVASRVVQAMTALRCPPGPVFVASLSGGERRRVALCRLLLAQPDLLLLDEPTNHLDTDSTNWLRQHLAHYSGTFVTVTHDRSFLDTVATRIVEVEHGRVDVFAGGYGDYVRRRLADFRVDGRRDEQRLRLLEREYASLGGESVRGRPNRDGHAPAGALVIPPPPRLGTNVIELDSVSKAFDGHVTLNDVSFTVPRDGIVGVLGPNGVGKTTLFEMISGHLAPDSGVIRIGDTVRIAYVDQARSGIDVNRTAWEAVADGEATIRLGSVEVPARAYVARFGFTGRSQEKPVKDYSGGERNRLNLALTLKQGGNVLLLDEPSNDLDTESLIALEQALLDFDGSAMITSHDRWFLNRVATHILAWEGTPEDPGTWYWFEGNLAAYEENRTQRSPELAQTGGPYRRMVRG